MSLLLGTPQQQSDLNVLRDPLNPTGYHGVVRLPGNRYRARPFRKKTVGIYDSPRQAALAIVAWWRQYFGPDWQKYFLCRSCVPFALQPVAGKGFLLAVWEEGERRVLFPRGRAYFATKHEAKAYLREFVRREYPPILGQSLHWLVLRRTQGPPTARVLRPLAARPAPPAPRRRPPADRPSLFAGVTP